MSKPKTWRHQHHKVIDSVEHAIVLEDPTAIVFYPETSLDGYVYHSLKKLEKWGAVEKKPDGSWMIKKDFE